MVPLKEKYLEKIALYACDFSPNAVQLLQQTGVCEKAFVKDLVSKEPISEIPDGHLDFVTMIFFLSAIHPDQHL